MTIRILTHRTSLRRWNACLCLIVLLLAVCSAVQAQDYTYTTANKKVTITGYTGNATVISIPSTIDESPVTSIGDQAFRDCGSLTSITVDAANPAYRLKDARKRYGKPKKREEGRAPGSENPTNNPTLDSTLNQRTGITPLPVPFFTRHLHPPYGG